MFEISKLDRKIKVNFFQKVRPGAKKSKFFSTYLKKVHRVDFFKVLKVTVEKQVSEVRRMYQIRTFGILIQVIK